MLHALKKTQKTNKLGYAAPARVVSQWDIAQQTRHEGGRVDGIMEGKELRDPKIKAAAASERERDEGEEER